MTRLPAIASLILAAAVLAGCSPAAVGTVTPGSLPPTATPTTAPSATPVPTAEPTPVPTPSGPLQVQPGETVTVTKEGGDWANITVSKVAQKTKYAGAYYSDTPAAGNIYIEAWVTYEALVDGVDYNPFDWQVFVAGVAVDNYTFVSNGPEPTLGSGTLPKGRKAEGWVVYEVPKAGQVLMSYGQTFGNAPPVFEVELRAS